MKLEELRERLENIKNMDNMSDLEEQVSLKDELTSQIQYSNDLEKELLLELEETKDFSKREELNTRIQKLRKDKDEKQAQATEIEEMLSEEKQRRSEEKQNAKMEFTAELQERQDKIKAGVNKKQKQIEELEASRKEFLDTIKENETILKLKKPDSKVYISATEENAKCIEEARKNNKRVKRLTRDIAKLEQESSDIDTILQEIDKIEQLKKPEEAQRNDAESKPKQEEPINDEEVKKQEDLMWSEYRQEREDKKAKEIDKAYQEKEEQEKIEEKQRQEDYKKEIDIFDEIEKQTGSKSSKNTEQTGKPTVQQGQEKNEKGSETGEPKNSYSIGQISFVIEENQPTYHLIVKNEKGEEVETISIQGFDEIKTIDEDKEMSLARFKNIHQPGKYYDVNVEKLLIEADKKYNTSGLKKYEEMMRKVELISQRGEILDIDYDFSELYLKPEDKNNRQLLKKLKNIAKANRKKDLASYEKEPDILKKLLKKIKTKSLPEALREHDKYNVDKRTQDLIDKMEQGRENLTAERLMKDLRELKDEPGFSSEVYKESKREAENKYRAYRESLKEDYESENSEKPEVSEVQREVADTVREIMDNGQEVSAETAEDRDEEER